MSATKGQQIGIWIIAIVMTVGTIGSFVVLILANDNDAKDAATKTQVDQTEYAAQLEAVKKQQQANADNSVALDGYSPSTFDPASITALQKEILVSGTGDELKATDTIKVSYFGWTSNGVIFDSSKKKDVGKDEPIELSLSGVIKGWTDGLTGQRVGSTVKLSIPADQAYGPTGSGIIGANEPLVFIVTIQSIGAAATE